MRAPAPLSSSTASSISFKDERSVFGADGCFNKWLTRSDLISRCACLVLWTEANYDPCIPGQRGAVPGLRVQPETYDETSGFVLTPSSKGRTTF